MSHPDTVAIYREHTADGQTYTQIAAARRMTRQQIAGIIHRYRKAKSIAAPGRIAKAARARSATARHPVQNAVSKPLKTTPKITAPPRAVPLAALGRHECRFPVSSHDAPREGHLFCGLATEDASYCPAHRSIATAS